MVKVVIPGPECWCAERLQRAGFVVTAPDIDTVPSLDLRTSEDVWVISNAVFEGAEWARLRVELNRAPRFFLVALADPDTQRVVSAMRDGALNVLGENDPVRRWEDALVEASDSQQLWLRLYAGRFSAGDARLVGCSVAMSDLRRDLERLGPTNVTVLVQGESGVGKECVSVALHEAGRGGPLVTLNCAAMPRELIEAELFGAEKGAFTGAVRARPGLVEQAAGGTLFLDEIGELDLSLQPKLLRFLETRRARRVGGDAEYKVDLRVVAATNRNLEQAVNQGLFRSDLYYRIAEVVLHVPPLRERPEDVPALVRTFVATAAERFGRHFDAVEPGLLLRFQEYHWPGNVRELKSAVDRLVLFHEGPMLRSGWWEPPGAPVTTTTPSSQGAALEIPETTLPSRSARIDLARKLLSEGRLSLSEIAARAGVHPTTLFRWRKSGTTERRSLLSRDVTVM